MPMHRTITQRPKANSAPQGKLRQYTPAARLQIGNWKLVIGNVKENRPANSCEQAGRKYQGRFGFTGVARHRLENRRIWPIPYFKGGAFCFGGIKSAAKNNKSCRKCC